MRKLTDQRYRNSILMDGLILCLVPALVGTASLLMLNHLWAKSVDLAQRESANAAVVNEGHSVISDLIRYHSMVLTEMGGGRRPKQGSVKESREALLAHTQELEQLSVANPAFAPQFEPIRRVVQEASDIKRFAPFIPTADEDMMTRMMKQARLGVEMAKNAYLVCKDTESLFDTQTKQLEAIRAQQDAQQRTLNIAAYATFFTSFILAGVLVTLFNLRFRPKLLKLIGDVERLTEPGAPIEPIAGNDEAALLSRELAEVKQQLAEADARRKAMVELVAHDVRSPLMAAQVSLQLFVKTSADQLPKDQQQTLRDVGVQMQETVTFADSVLKTGQLQLDQSESLPVVPALPKNSMLLAKKILLIVCVPLLLQTGWLAWLAIEINNTQTLTNAVRKQADIVSAINRAVVMALQAGCAGTLCLLSRNPQLRTVAIKDFDRTSDAVAKIRAELETDPRSRRYIETVEIVTAASRHFVEESNLEPDAEFGSRIQSMRKVETLVAQGARSNIEQQALLSRQQAVLDGQRQRLADHQRAVNNILLAGAVINIAAGLLLLLFFSLSIDRRVRLLIENVRALISKKATIYKIPGSDELTILNETVRVAGDQLQKLTEQRRSVISLMTANMRTPLLYVVREVDTIKQRLPKEFDRDDLEEATMNLEHVLQLISDLLDFETVESGTLTMNKRPVQISDVVAGAVATVAALAQEKQIEIHNSCESGEQVVADPDRVRQVLINLLSNAIKFSPEKSKVIVSGALEGNFLCLSVEDEGPGIASEQADAIFKERVRLDERAAGYGLGLTISKAIVSAHSGAIGVTPGVRTRGSRFYFTLPRSPVAASIS